MHLKKWLLIMVVFIVILSGCSSRDANRESSEAQSSDAVVKIEYMTVQTGSAPPEESNDYIRNKILDEVGLAMERTIYNDNSEYWNQLNVRLASGNYPDLMMLDRNHMIDLVKQDMLLDLTPYLDRLQPVRAILGEDNLKKGTVNGKLYAIPKKPAKFPYASSWIRKDWLENLKLDVPETLEQLMQVAKAFTDNDPDGNNQNDTYGFTGGGLLTFSPIFGAFGVGMPGTTYIRDGQVINSLYDPNMEDALAFIKNMMDSGVVDPDILSYSLEVAADKMYEGKAGIVFNSFVYLTSASNIPKVTAIDPNAEWIQIAPPVGPGGLFDGIHDIGQTSTLNGVSRSVANNPEKLDKIIDMLNYIATPEGGVIVTLGEEGRHWETNDQGIKVRKSGDFSSEITYIYQFLGRDDFTHLPSVGYPVDVINYLAETPRLQTYDGYISLPEGYNAADATRYINEEFAKFIYGKRSLSEYKDFLNTLATTFKYQTYLDTTKQQLTDLGIVK